MSDRPTPRGPEEAEKVWFLITDRFYRELNTRGPRAALVVAQRALDAIVAPSDMPQRGGRPQEAATVAPDTR